LLAEKPLSVLRSGLDDKARLRQAEALNEVEEALKEAASLQDQLKQGLNEIATYDATWVDVSLAEGLRRIRKRVNEQQQETNLLRSLYEKSDGAITASKIALLDTVTADHRWHPPEDKCPHVRCVALNAIEELRGG
jgi:tRNA C32,U32 (ribose-2'-O)-methylase TrmJ